MKQFCCVKKKGGKIIIRADIDESSINTTERTFDVVFATENPILRSPWWADETFFEVLVCDKKSLRHERLDAGVVPLLDTHNGSSVTVQYGIVRSWSIKDRECRATIAWSLQESKADLWKDIEAKIIRSLSVGAKVYQYDRVPNTDPKKTATYRAVDWETVEISMAPVPLDYMSSVRSEEKENAEHEIEIKNYIKRSVMKKEHIKELRDLARAAGLSEEFTDDLISRCMVGDGSEGSVPLTVEAARAEIEAKKPAPPAPLTQADITRALEAEANRCNDIRQAVRSHMLPETFADDLIGRKEGGKGLTVDRAKVLILDELAKTDSGPAGGGSPSARGDEKAAILRAMSEGMMHRAEPGSVERYYKLGPNKDDKFDANRTMDIRAHDYKHMRFVDIARAILTMNHVPNAANMADADVVQRALDTTDLPDLFTSTIKRELRLFYEPIVPEWMQFSKNVPANDFRVKTGIKFDAAVTFEELDENGEYKEANMMSNEKATIQLQTFARSFSVTRQTIINDDLGVLTDIPRAIGIGARQFQSKKAWALITGNVVCPDGNTLFHAKHGNWATGASASAITDAALSQGRTAMRRQKSPQGNELLITPKFLLVPPELETTAQKFLKAIYPTTVQAVNLWQSLEPFVNVYFANTQQWYMVADPGTTTVDGMVHSYLTGQEGLYTESYIEKKSDKLVIKARLDFACSMWGWQGWYRNDGSGVVA